MSSNIPFINIHSHSVSTEFEVSIQNVFLQDYFAKIGAKGQLISVGLHPWHLAVSESVEQVKSALTIVISQNSTVALGETGLDKSIDVPLDLQEVVFRAHVEVSEQHRKPLIIHCLRAFQEILAIRKEQNASQAWIFHGFNGSPQLAKQIINTGCIVSFGKAILKDSNRATHSLLNLSIGEFFLETDSDEYPIKDIYERAAWIKQVDVEVLKKIIFEKFVALFGSNVFPTI